MVLGASKADYETYQFDVPQPSLTINTANLKDVMGKLGLDPECPVIAICPGAEFGPAKQWPLENHRALAEKLVQQGFQVWVMGGPKDVEPGEQIANGQEEIGRASCRERV